MGKKYPTKWIGRADEFLPRFLDLTSMDYVKNIAYSTPPLISENVIQREVFKSISPTRVRNMRKTFEERVKKCAVKKIDISKFSSES